MAGSLGNQEIDLPFLLHELAEGLQSVGNYLSALRRVARGDADEATITIDILEKALDELGRSKGAFHHLRAHLLVSASMAGEAAARNDDPSRPAQTNDAQNNA